MANGKTPRPQMTVNASPIHQRVVPVIPYPGRDLSRRYMYAVLGQSCADTMSTTHPAASDHPQLVVTQWALPHHHMRSSLKDDQRSHSRSWSRPLSPLPCTTRTPGSGGKRLKSDRFEGPPHITTARSSKWPQDFSSPWVLLPATALEPHRICRAFSKGNRVHILGGSGWAFRAARGDQKGECSFIVPQYLNRTSACPRDGWSELMSVVEKTGPPVCRA